MHLVLDSHHLSFFTQHGYIAFVDLFPEKILAMAEHLISTNARDLWRTHPIIKTLTFHKNSAEIAAKLTHTPSIRLAYDQSLCTHIPLTYPSTPFSLSEVSCVQPIICVMIIRLSQGPKITQKIPYCPCPMQQREILFVSGKTLLTLSPLWDLPMQKFFFVAYSDAHPQYIPRTNDPFVHSLKALGYAFGDHLDISTHPVLYSSMPK